MRRSFLLILCALLTVSLTGCIKTYTYEAKRVDQDLSHGNRGVIMGDEDVATAERKSTRTMIGIDVELPAGEDYKGRREVVKERPLPEKKIAAAEEEVIIEKPERFVGEEVQGFEDEQWVKGSAGTPAAEGTTYKVEKGDTLQKISRKFYGTTKKWPEIYEANKDALKHPSKIYPGQVIRIPAETPDEIPADIK